MSRCTTVVTFASAATSDTKVDHCKVVGDQSPNKNMKKITVTLTVKLDVHMDEDGSVDNVLSEMDYEFSDQTGTASVVSSEITDWQVTDAR